MAEGASGNGGIRPFACRQRSHMPNEQAEGAEMELRTASSPRDVKHYTTERLREEFLIQGLFPADEIKLVYSHIDRIITGTATRLQRSWSLRRRRASCGIFPAEKRAGRYQYRRRRKNYR